MKDMANSSVDKQFRPIQIAGNSYKDPGCKTLLIIIAIAIKGISFLGAQSNKNDTLNPYAPDPSTQMEIAGLRLIWNDEFNADGKPDETRWNYESGFVRNHELQWYQPQNAYCRDGRLIIEGRKEKVFNPNYNPDGDDWRSNRKYANYSSSSLRTKGLHEWTDFGYYEIRARIDTSNGAWPAIWMLGSQDKWPFCGEIDIMEFYRIEGNPYILANVAWGSESRYRGEWDTGIKPLQDFLDVDPEWHNKFHLFSMKWDRDKIELFVDDYLVNEIELDKTVNPDGRNPFTGGNNQYLILNLALGSNGGDPSSASFPITFEVDYVRIYKPK